MYKRCPERFFHFDDQDEEDKDIDGPPAATPDKRLALDAVWQSVRGVNDRARARSINRLPLN